jgi:hypothetical protein
MKQIKENITFLKAVALLSKDQVKAILSHISKSQILAVVEIARNILTGIVTLKRGYKKSLKLYKRVIRDLADKHATLNTRRHLITSKADVITLLIKSVLPKLVAVVGHG